MGDKGFHLSLSIVIPTYKERDNLAIFIPEIEAGFTGIFFEIIIVDDNSQDGTREMVAQLQKQFTNIRIIERSCLLGIGSALREGYNIAQGDYIMSSDADLSFRVEDMLALYQKTKEGYDIVLGFKVASAAAPMRMKYCLSHFCNWIIRQISGLGGLKDFNTNFRILRASFWRKINTKEDRNFFLFETILKAKRKGAKISEIPVIFYDRKFGKTKLNFLKEAPRYFFKLICYIFFVK